MTADLPTQIAAILRRSRSVLIACHVAPDGDCLGSALALQLALARAGLHAQVASADGVPEPFRALPGAGRILTAPTAARAEVGVAIECSTLERAGPFAQVLAEAPTVINIDHHVSNAGYGHLVYRDTSAAAVGEQVARIIQALRIPLDREIAQCLLTAVVTDTGVFRYRNTTAPALRLAADLVDAGASVTAIVERVYETYSAASRRLLGMVLTGFRLSADGRIAWATVTPDMLAAAGATAEETTGFVGMLRQIRGVQVALLFEVTADGVRVGIRSRDEVRSNVIAEAFGGGGHQGAAGFTGPPPLDRTITATLAEVEKELRRVPAPSRS